MERIGLAAIICCPAEGSAEQLVEQVHVVGTRITRGDFWSMSPVSTDCLGVVALACKRAYMRQLKRDCQIWPTTLAPRYSSVLLRLSELDSNQ